MQSGFIMEIKTLRDQLYRKVTSHEKSLTLTKVTVTARHLPLKTIIGRYQLRGQSLLSAAVKNHFILIICSLSCISINALAIDVSIYTPTWHNTTRWSQKGKEVRIN